MMVANPVLSRRAQLALEAFQELARPAILERFTPDSCIASSRIATRVFERLGFHCLPLSVRMIVGNRTFGERFRELGRLPVGGELAAWREAGSYSVGVGLGPAEPGKLATHVVAILERGVMVDASADQAARPGRGIVIPGVVTRNVTRGFRKLRQPIQFWDGDTWFMYRAEPTDREFITSTNWTSGAQWGPVADYLVRAIQERLP